MNKMKIYGIKDNKVSSFGLPFFDRSDVEAKRQLAYVVNKTDSQIAQYPEDFDLFQLGEFDEQTGTIIPFTAPTFIVGAYSLKINQNSPKDEAYHGE